MNKIDRETAEKDFDTFCEILNLSELKRAKLEEDSDGVIQLIEYGYLEIGSENEIEEIRYNLEVPIPSPEGEKDHLTFVKHKRFRVKDIERLTAGSKTDIESARRMMGALLGLNSGVIKDKMDGEDFTNLGKISAFFLPR